MKKVLILTTMILAINSFAAEINNDCNEVKKITPAVATKKLLSKKQFLKKYQKQYL